MKRVAQHRGKEMGSPNFIAMRQKPQFPHQAKITVKFFESEQGLVIRDTGVS